MAKEDYDAADRDLTANGGALTAGDKVNVTTWENPDDDAREFAAANGVSEARFVGYAEALNKFQERPDIESLRARRLREYGDEFSDADFMRQAAYEADGTSTDAPRPGTIFGEADEEGTFNDATTSDSTPFTPVEPSTTTDTGTGTGA